MVAVSKPAPIDSAELSAHFMPPAYFTPAHCQAIREVGRGGMAVVYEACDQQKERFALKVSLPSLPHSELGRFRQEVTIGRRLQHPGVPRIYEHGRYDGGAWITMEYVDGEPLEQRIEDATFTTSERLNLLWAISDTLQHAHDRGVIHRDVKPANIVIGHDYPKLLDFGIAKFTNIGVTNPDCLVGTPSHMAPEQLFGEEIDHRADIFQLGVLTHELFANGLPWSGEHPVRIAWAICNEEPMPLSSHLREELGLPPEIVAQLEVLVRSALSRSPDDRPASAAAFRQQIELIRRRFGLGAEIHFSAPVWDVTEGLVVLGPADLSLDLPPSFELLFATNPEEALSLLLRCPRRRLVVDCESVEHESVLDVLDVLSSWGCDGAATLLCDDLYRSARYVLRGARVLPRSAVAEIHQDLLAA